MDSTAPESEPEPEPDRDPGAMRPGPERDAIDHEYFRRVLLRIVQVGAELVEDLSPHAPTQRDHPDLRTRAEREAAHEHLARSIRRCIYMLQHLGEPARRRVDAREHILRTVETTIARAERSPARAETLREELRERIDAPEFQNDLDRPVAQVVTEITQDLGLDKLPGVAPWPRRTPDDVRALKARAAGHPIRDPRSNSPPEPLSKPPPEPEIPPGHILLAAFAPGGHGPPSRAGPS